MCDFKKKYVSLLLYGNIELSPYNLVNHLQKTQLCAYVNQALTVKIVIKMLCVLTCFSCHMICRTSEFSRVVYTYNRLGLHTVAMVVSYV